MVRHRCDGDLRRGGNHHFSLVGSPSAGLVLDRRPAMIATFHEQMSSDTSRGAPASLECRSTPAHGSLTSSRRRQVGSQLPHSSLGAIESLNLAGLRPGHLSSRREKPRRLIPGWCFTSSRQYLEFHALRRAGVRAEHAAPITAHLAIPLSAKTPMRPVVHLDPSKLPSFDHHHDREGDGSVPSEQGVFLESRGELHHVGS